MRDLDKLKPDYSPEYYLNQFKENLSKEKVRAKKEDTYKRKLNQTSSTSYYSLEREAEDMIKEVYGEEVPDNYKGVASSLKKSYIIEGHFKDKYKNQVEALANRSTPVDEKAKALTKMDAADVNWLKRKGLISDSVIEKYNDLSY
jgi:ribosomal protein S4